VQVIGAAVVCCSTSRGILATPVSWVIVEHPHYARYLCANGVPLPSFCLSVPRNTAGLLLSAYPSASNPCLLLTVLRVSPSSGCQDSIAPAAYSSPAAEKPGMAFPIPTATTASLIQLARSRRAAAAPLTATADGPSFSASALRVTTRSGPRPGPDRGPGRRHHNPTYGQSQLHPAAYIDSGRTAFLFFLDSKSTHRSAVCHAGTEKQTRDFLKLPPLRCGLSRQTSAASTGTRSAVTFTQSRNAWTVALTTAFTHTAFHLAKVAGPNPGGFAWWIAVLLWGRGRSSRPIEEYHAW